MSTAPRVRAEVAALVALLGLVLGLTLHLLLPFLGTIVVALVSAGLLFPWHRRLTARLGGRPRLSATILCVAMVAVVLAPLFATLVSVSQEALRFYELTSAELDEGRLRSHIEERRQSLESISAVTAPLGLDLRPDSISQQLATVGEKVGQFFYRQGVSLARRLVRLALAFVLWVVILYYTLIDGDQLRSWVERTLPVAVEHQRLMGRRFIEMTRSIVIGNGIAGLIQGVGGGLLFVLLDLPAPMLWGMVMGILAFLPVVGISLVYIPGFLILIVTDSMLRAFLFLVPLMILATLVEYMWKPAVVGRRMHMHTALVLLAILGGFQAYGPMGVLVGPLVVTALLTLSDVGRELRASASVQGDAEVDGGAAAR